MLECKTCGRPVDLTATACLACGTELELGRLTGILGLVCRACDAFNDPGTSACSSCGAPLGAGPSEPPEGAPGPERVAPPSPGQPVMRAFQKGTPSATKVVSLTPSPSPAPAPAPAPAPPPAASAIPTARTAAAVLGPLSPGRARLVLERGAGLDGGSFRLDAERVVAGRSHGQLVFPDDPCLAPHHATFFYREGALHLRDEGAPGGIYLRLRGPSVPLRPGDHFAIGDHLLVYVGLLPGPPPGLPDGTRRLGAPRPPSPAAVLEERLEGGAAGRVFVRTGPSITIGRAGCAVALGEDPHVARTHAELLVDPAGGARLRDLGSPDGTFVRVPAHAECELHDGDGLRLGREVLRVAVA